MSSLGLGFVVYRIYWNSCQLELQNSLQLQEFNDELFFPLRVVLEEMAAYERQQASDIKKNISTRKQLEPIAFTGPGESALLQKVYI